MNRFSIKIGDDELFGCNLKHSRKDFTDDNLIAVLKTVVSILEEKDKPVPLPKIIVDTPPDSSFDLPSFIIMTAG